VVSEHLPVIVGSASRALCEPDQPSVVHHVLEEQDRLIVHLPDLLMDLPVKRLQVDIVCQARDVLEPRLAEEVPEVWLVEELETDHIGLVNHVPSNHLPHIGKAIRQSISIVIQRLKCVCNILGEVVIPKYVFFALVH